MTIRTRVDKLLHRVMATRPHQGLRLALADAVLPADVRDPAMRLMAAPQPYRDRVDAECARMFPALDAWMEATASVPWPSDGYDDDELDRVDWDAPAWYLMPVPVTTPAVLRDADRALAGLDAGDDDLQRDALALAVYGARMARLLALPMADLERMADALGV